MKRNQEKALKLIRNDKKQKRSKSNRLNIETNFSIVRQEIPSFPVVPSKNPDSIDINPEFKFHKNRRWKFDYAIPKIKLAIELNGGVHRIRNRYLRDLEKLNEAQINGWMVIQIDNDDVYDGTAAYTIARAYNAAVKRYKLHRE